MNNRYPDSRALDLMVTGFSAMVVSTDRADFSQLRMAGNSLDSRTNDQAFPAELVTWTELAVWFALPYLDVKAAPSGVKGAQSSVPFSFSL